MLSFIPIDQYKLIYDLVTFLLAILVLIQTSNVQLGTNQNQAFMSFSGYFLILFLLVFIGLRPIHGIFVDMTLYAKLFVLVQSNVMELDSGGDFAYGLLFQFLVGLVDVNTFFFIVTLVYIIPLYLASKRWFGGYWFYGFAIIVFSFSFWAYGVNGIRNGMATSLLIYAFSHSRLVLQTIWGLVAVGFHNSVLLPFAAFWLTRWYKNVNAYLILWILSIPISFLLGPYIIDFIASSGLVDERRVGYFTTDYDQSQFSRSGFRWDFLIYSSTGVLIGWYFIFKANFNDELYLRLYSTYLISNAFWILVMSANFSNRFAYLSWFMLGVVSIYPLLKLQIHQRQHLFIGAVIFFTAFFTFFMSVVYSS